MNKPYPPLEPKQPEFYIYDYKSIQNYSSNILTLQEVLDELGLELSQIDPNKLYIRYESGDRFDHSELKIDYREPIRNEKYEKDFQEYLDNYKLYEKHLEEYFQNLRKWEECKANQEKEERLKLYKVLKEEFGDAIG